VNKQIEELAEQCGFRSNPNVYDRNQSFDIEKFAELIVRECANHCDLLLDHKMSSEWSRGTHDCSKAIKKHFGVEE
jgi:hypothetical protein